MLDNAYALFFAAVLIGTAFALWTTLRAHLRDVAAVLRGEMVLPPAPVRARTVRFRSGRRPAFPPIRLSISRL
jgi:hypothetical protein